MSDKAWGGRFEEELDAIAARFSASVDVDGRLWPQDIDGSIAHVRMLAAAPDLADLQDPHRHEEHPDHRGEQGRQNQRRERERCVEPPQVEAQVQRELHVAEAHRQRHDGCRHQGEPGRVRSQLGI